jgi:hypothetical protein
MAWWWQNSSTPEGSMAHSWAVAGQRSHRSWRAGITGAIVVVMLSRSLQKLLG